MGIFNTLMILLQTNIPTDGLEDSAASGDVKGILIWIISILAAALLFVSGLLWRELQRKTKQLEDSKDDYADKIEDLSRTHTNKLDDINRESMKKSDNHNETLLAKVDEWNKQWAESEKYAMDVIKGLNNLIASGDAMTNNRHSQIIDKMTALETNLLNSIKLLKETFKNTDGK